MMSRKDFLKKRVGAERIFDEWECREYTEFVVSIGGDILTYRVYGSNGNYEVCER